MSSRWSRREVQKAAQFCAYRHRPHDDEELHLCSRANAASRRKRSLAVIAVANVAAKFLATRDLVVTRELRRLYDGSRSSGLLLARRLLAGLPAARAGRRRAAGASRGQRCRCVVATAVPPPPQLPPFTPPPQAHHKPTKNHQARPPSLHHHKHTTSSLAKFLHTTPPSLRHSRATPVRRRRPKLTRDSEPEEFFSTNMDSMSDAEKLKNPVVIGGVAILVPFFLVGLVARDGQVRRMWYFWERAQSSHSSPAASAERPPCGASRASPHAAAVARRAAARARAACAPTSTAAPLSSTSPRTSACSPSSGLSLPRKSPSVV